jgi:hypothetical protein
MQEEDPKVSQMITFNLKLLQKDEKINRKDYCTSFLNECKQEIIPPYINLFFETLDSSEEFRIHQDRLIDFGISFDGDNYIKQKRLTENVDYKIIYSSVGLNVLKKKFFFNHQGLTKCISGIHNLGIYHEYLIMLENIQKNYLEYEKEFENRVNDRNKIQELTMNERLKIIDDKLQKILNHLKLE